MKRRLANALVLAGAVCLLVVGGVRLEALRLELVHQDAGTFARGNDLSPGVALAWLEVPRLGISALVRHGVGEEVLRSSIGHVPGTALPGSGGNSGLAAHRDAQFRPLEEVRAGDLVRLRTATSTVDYRVVSTRIVEPDEVEVLAPNEGATLTLVTCYPFRWIGPAPRRFVVRAEAIAG